MASKEMVKFLDNLDSNQLVELSEKSTLREALNVNPPKDWVKTNKYANDSKYMPIGRIESLLDSIFQDWQVEIKSVSQLAQSICAIVRLHYKDPITNEWRYHDGVGATPLKTDKGFTAADLAHIKSDAVQTGAPSAISYAIKDAAKHLGNLFGKSLNREDGGEVVSIYEERANKAEKEISHMQLILAQSITRETKRNLVDVLDEVGNLSVEELKSKFKEVENAH